MLPLHLLTKVINMTSFMRLSKLLHHTRRKCQKMEIRRWLFFTFFNCILIQYLKAKTVSLNEIIAAERQTAADKQPKKNTDRVVEPNSDSKEFLTSETTIRRAPKKLPPLKLPGLLKQSLLFKRLVSDAKIRTRKLANTISGIEKLSPLKFRKAFQIKSPLKPKKLKVSRRSRLKRKNQSRKREVNPNDVTHKYIPVLKSLGVLFDNLLDSDTSNSYEVKPKKYKRNRFYSEERFELSHDSPEATSRFKSHKKTTAPTSSVSTKVSSDAKNLTLSNDYDNSTIRSNTIIPILLSRDTSSSRRDDTRPSERSGTTFYGDIEGNITRHHGDHEYNAGSGEIESREEGDENYTYSATRSDSSGIGHSRGIRINARDSKNTQTFNNKSQSVDNRSKIENANDSIGENQLKTGREEIKSEISVREPVRGLRGFVPRSETTDDDRIVPEPIQLQEIRKESILSSPDDSTGHKRITDKDGPITTEDEKIRKRNETVILIERNSKGSDYSQGTNKKGPVVMIFDGYSVTRDKNGENKVSGKTIHVHSQNRGE